MSDLISLVDAPLTDRRDAAFKLMNLFVPSVTGSKAFETITQGRSLQAEKIKLLFSTCGFLVHFMWFRLGCRDYRYMTYDDPSTPEDEYKVGKNITKIYYGGQAAGLFLPYHEGMALETGDVFYIDNDTMTNAHVGIYMGATFNDANEICWRTAEAGQVNEANRQCAKFKKRTVKNGRVEDGRRIMGIFPLGNVVLSEDADLSAP